MVIDQKWMVAAAAAEAKSSWVLVKAMALAVVEGSLMLDFDTERAALVVAMDWMKQCIEAEIVAAAVAVVGQGMKRVCKLRVHDLGNN